MEFLKDINWKSDDGVFLPMINDVARNVFYEQIIKPNVKDRNCVDIGFGTGLLSMIALKHGAKHVVAYEQDTVRYQLGQHIITELGLQDRIELYQQQYTWQTSLPKDSVVISETMGPGIWGEGLWYSIPRVPGRSFLPNNLFFQIELVPISQNFVEHVESRLPGMHSYFAPGIDVDCRFVELINNLIESKVVDSANKNQGIIKFDYLAQPVWGGGAHYRLAQALGTSVGRYDLDIEKQTLTVADSHGTKVSAIDFDRPQQTLSIDLSLYDQPVLLVPRVGLRHNEISMFLDEAESWHWMSYPVIVTPDVDRITVTHQFANGDLEYQIG